MPKEFFKKADKEPSVITEQDFIERMNDLGNRLFAVNMLIQGNLSIEQIKDNLKNNSYPSFEENLNIFHQTISTEMLNDPLYKEAIVTHDRLVEKMKNQDFNSVDELKEILNQSKQLRNIKRETKDVKNIETEEQFWYFVADAKNQFIGIRFQIDQLDDKDLSAYNKKLIYLPLSEYLKKENRFFSEKILNNDKAQGVIKTFDDLISRVKVFQTKQELNQIIEELDELLGEFYLGLNEN